MSVLPRNHRLKLVDCPYKNQPIEVMFKRQEKLHLPDFEIAFCPALTDGSVRCNRDCLKQLDMNLVSKTNCYRRIN